MAWGRAGSVGRVVNLSEAKQGLPWLVRGWETRPARTPCQLEGRIWGRILQGIIVGPTVCPQFRTAGTRTLGGVGKKGLPAEFARSRPAPGALPPKGESQKKVPQRRARGSSLSLARQRL